jgi:hypothetical protein
MMSIPVNGSSLDVVGLAERVAFSESTLFTAAGEVLWVAGVGVVVGLDFGDVLGVFEREAPVSFTDPSCGVYAPVDELASAALGASSAPDAMSTAASRFMMV